MREIRLLLLLFWWLFGYLYALDFYNWRLAIVVGLAWQKLAGKEIPANANDPRWRRRDALHFHGKNERADWAENFAAAKFHR